MCGATDLLGPVKGVQNVIAVCVGASVEGTEEASVRGVVLREGGLCGAGGDDALDDSSVLGAAYCGSGR